MTKAQALHEFWASFGLPAYDENTVPIDAQIPRITYSVSTDSFENTLFLSANLWYKSTSWKEISEKAEEIAERIGVNGYTIKAIDNGYLWIVKGTPFAQRMSDPSDDSIRRIYINIIAEFLTAY